MGELTLLDMTVALGHEESVREILKRHGFQMSPGLRGKVSPQITGLLKEHERAQPREDGDDALGGMFERQFARWQRQFGHFDGDPYDDGPEPLDEDPRFRGFGRPPQYGDGFNQSFDGPDSFGHRPQFGGGPFNRRHPRNFGRHARFGDDEDDDDLPPTIMSLRIGVQMTMRMTRDPSDGTTLTGGTVCPIGLSVSLGRECHGGRNCKLPFMLPSGM
jgi:hypothetical protein